MRTPSENDSLNATIEVNKTEYPSQRRYIGTGSPPPPPPTPEEKAARERQSLAESMATICREGSPTRTDRRLLEEELFAKQVEELKNEITATRRTAYFSGDK